MTSDGAVAEELRQVAHLVHQHVVVPQIFVGPAGRVPVVVEAAAAEAVEVVVAALERAEVRQRAQVPLADERRAVAAPA